MRHGLCRRPSSSTSSPGESDFPTDETTAFSPAAVAIYCRGPVGVSAGGQCFLPPLPFCLLPSILSALLALCSALSLSLSLSLLLSATPRYPAFRLPSLLIGRSRFGDSSGHHNPSPRGCALVALGSRASSVTGAPSHLATCGHGPMRVSSPLTPSPPTDGPFLQPRSIGWE